MEVNNDGEMNPRYALSNLQSQTPEESDIQNDETQTDGSQFGHAVIDVNIDYNDIQTGSKNRESNKACAEPISSAPNQLEQPQINTVSFEASITSLQLIPIEDERVFDTERFHVHSNPPRAPG